MYNILLDPMPTSYKGYLIRTDYRIGIQIAQALEDESLTPYERVDVAFSLLYGEGRPPVETAYEGLAWFLSGGIASEPAPQDDSGGDSEGDGMQYFSFEQDAGRLYSGFRRAYGIDLDKESMHWFRFLALLGDLGKCAFTQVIDYRTADLSKMDKDTRRAYAAMRRKFALPQQESPETSEFMRLLNGG